MSRRAFLPAGIFTPKLSLALQIIPPLTVCALVFSLQGCIGGRSGATQYQLLTANAEKNADAPLAGKSIGIGPVHVAQFLQRPQIVTHSGGTQLQMSENSRWGEPLEQGVQRTLLQNLAALTGAETRNFPWRQNTTPDYALRIDVIDLDKLTNGESILDVNWLIEDLTNTRVIKTQQERLSSNKDYNDLFTQLARHVADALNK
jgi:uncharacterized protein